MSGLGRNSASPVVDTIESLAASIQRYTHQSDSGVVIQDSALLEMGVKV